MARRAFAVAAHPDDIEFLMAGTLSLLAQAGYELHMLTVANGSCGTSRHGRDEIVRLRAAEARAAAESIGAHYHASLVDDLEIFYGKPLLTRLAAVMRDVAPEILLTHSPVDYMEDHQNAARLAVTAAFSRGMSSYITEPPRPPVTQEVTVYHAQPHGNCDPLRRLVYPEFYVDISAVMPAKRGMLAHHRSQSDWLDESQGMDSYLDAMTESAAALGEISGRFRYAEGWRRRLHLGFCGPNANPLIAALPAGLVWAGTADAS
jgi:N-acetylglucosamine malate deacetylase 1